MLEWTVKATYPNATADGVRLVDAHFLIQAPDAQTAERQASVVTYDGIARVPRGAVIKAVPRCM